MGLLVDAYCILFNSSVFLSDALSIWTNIERICFVAFVRFIFLVLLYEVRGVLGEEPPAVDV